MRLLRSEMLIDGGYRTGLDELDMGARSDSVAEDLVERLPGYTAELLTIARFLVRDEAEAHDLVQATLELAIGHVAELRDPDRLRPWLVAIETREATRLRRRIARALRLPARLAAEAPQPAPNDVELAVREAVEALPSRMRAAVVLHYMVGLTVDETAAAMSVSTNTARTHLKAALRRLRENLT
jgi:RNA polymerase sigma factor (sigma-70 family)